MCKVRYNGTNKPKVSDEICLCARNFGIDLRALMIFHLALILFINRQWNKTTEFMYLLFMKLFMTVSRCYKHSPNRSVREMNEFLVAFVSLFAHVPTSSSFF